MRCKAVLKSVLAALAAWVALPALAAESGAKPPASAAYFMYVGTYTGPASKGVYGFRYEVGSGRFTPLGLMAEVSNPSWVTDDPKARNLYAITELGDGPRASSSTVESTVSAYSMDRSTGALKLLGRLPTGGTVAAQVSVDHTGRMLFVNNYGSGSVSAFALNPDGSIAQRVGFDQHAGSSVNPRRQTGPHPHAVVVSPDNRFLFVPDLGLDKIFSYRIDAAKQTFAPNDPAFVTVTPGLGPRHLAFAPNGKFVYAICEMGSSVVAFAYDAAKGALIPIQSISTLPEGFNGMNTSAEIAIDASGHFLYASNRGDDSIAVFHVESNTGKLDKLSVTPAGVKGPRTFAIDPTGKLLLAAGQNSNDISIFAIDGQTGALTPTGQVLKAPAPVSLLFVPAR